jgi:hypothetical protein
MRRSILRFAAARLSRRTQAPQLVMLNVGHKGWQLDKS